MQDINKKPGMYRLVFNQTDGEYGLLRDSECVVAEQYGHVLPEAMLPRQKHQG